MLRAVGLYTDDSRYAGYDTDHYTHGELVVLVEARLAFQVQQDAEIDPPFVGSDFGGLVLYRFLSFFRRRVEFATGGFGFFDRVRSVL